VQAREVLDFVKMRKIKETSEMANSIFLFILVVFNEMIDAKNRIEQFMPWLLGCSAPENL
jgi:hypothetical protein